MSLIRRYTSPVDVYFLGASSGVGLTSSIPSTTVLTASINVPGGTVITASIPATTVLTASVSIPSTTVLTASINVPGGTVITASINVPGGTVITSSIPATTVLTASINVPPGTVISASIVGGNFILSATLQPPDGTTDVELVTLSGTVFSQTGTFSADAYSTVFTATNVQYWSNLAITLINNSVNNLKSASIDFSPNNSNWEIWDTTTFTTLSSSAILSMQIAGNSRRWLRVRAWSSGSVGSNTGSLDVYVTTNNG